MLRRGRRGRRALTAPVGGVRSKLALAGYAGVATLAPAARLKAREDRTAAEHWAAMGLDSTAGSGCSGRSSAACCWRRLYDTSTTGWEHLATYDVPRALPAMPAPHDFQSAIRVDGVYGDHRDTSSIQGALASGERAARAVAADLGA